MTPLVALIAATEASIKADAFACLVLAAIGAAIVFVLAAEGTDRR